MANTFISTHIGRLRLMSILDAISYLILLGIAMPLKYFFDKPEAVSVVGMAHGVLFIGLCLAILIALVTVKLSFKWAVITFLCALVPVAPFVLDRKLRSF